MTRSQRSRNPTKPSFEATEVSVHPKLYRRLGVGEWEGASEGLGVVGVLEGPGVVGAFDGANVVGAVGAFVVGIAVG